MTISRDQKLALRKGAPANLKMSVSRPARRKNTVGLKGYTGVGNMNSYVQSIVNEAVGLGRLEPLSRSELSYLTSRVNRQLDSTGRVPSADSIVSMIG